MSTFSRHASQVCEALSLTNESKVERAIEILRLVAQAGGTVWLAGNGGSAATCNHFANDLVKMAKIKAVDMTHMVSTVMAYGNDHGWDRMFSNPFLALCGPWDAVVGISCSGNSPNVVNLLEAANCHKIGLTGPGDNKMARMISDPNVCILALSDEITVQEDVHSIICHSIVRSLAHG